MPDETTSTEPVNVTAKINLIPLILTTTLGTGVAVITTIFLTRYFEKQREEKEAEQAREREELAMSNPPMPMMWPGMMSQQQNPKQPSTAELESLTDRLESWEQVLRQREQGMNAREHHLKLIMGGGGGE
jgi:hypothetical protein